jgi:serine/threonine-protein kinase
MITAVTMITGTRLGPYEIQSAVGAGGMGEVYRARDSRLDRDVAIKILPELFAADPERLARFEREAKTLASLNHPHIAQIYGIEEIRAAAGGAGAANAALVMELVEGEDLSIRIARGPIPSAEALPVAQQVADALEAAHDRGIIHRDIKPANIKVTADGVVKVLDFGLAKALAPAGASASADAAANPANSPTMAMTGTVAGLILGTAGYMSPEQARGQTVDRRVDIWAFGVVLFEMLAGRQAFSGATVSDVLASVLKNDLDWTLLPKDVPAPVLALLRRCLNPDRRNRLRDIGEARIAIADFLAGKADAAAAAPARPRSAIDNRVLIGLLALLAVIGGIAAVMLWRDRTPPEGSRRFVVSPPDNVSPLGANRPSVALSPDGWTLVFAGVENGVSHLFIRGANDFDPRKLPGTEGASYPVFSPSGRTLAFMAETRLMVMPLDGSARPLGVTVNDPRGLAWIDETTLVYSPESIGGLMELSINGGAPKVVTTIDEKAGERTHRWPDVLPGGRWITFTVGTSASPDEYDHSRIDAVDRQTGERRSVFKDASMTHYLPSGHLAFARGGSLFAVRFDPESLKVSGSPLSVVEGIGGDRTTGAAHVAWSNNGTFAYLDGDVRGGQRRVVWSDLKGSTQSITLPPALYNDIRLSPDGARMAYALGTSSLADIWVYSFTRGTSTRLTFTGINATPVWSADGRDVYFVSIEGRRTTVFRTSGDGGREPAALTAIDGRAYLKHVDRGGAWGLVDYISFGGARANTGRIPLRSDGGTDVKPEPLVATRADEYSSSLSPDGRFVAYQSDEGGQPEVYVRELAASAGRWQVSNAGGEEPMWAADGRSIFYRIEGRLMRVTVDTRTTFAAGLPQVLFDGIFNLRSDTGISYQPHPDGTRFIMLRPAESASSGNVRVITRWLEGLETIR